ncbi:MAG: T9SS type A sorting domain-containing protein [Bacteroidia bacterium]|nr:T9SS type A sorting domain-containing protein [Bacteroidia bacterium]
MKKTLYILILLIAIGNTESVMAQNLNSVSQATCYSNANVYAFIHNGHYYNVVKEAKTWSVAAACASSDAGYLVEINDQAEQTAVYNGIVASGIASNYSPVGDGGGVSYVWLGGNDKFTEGDWWWDGDNNGIGMKFWVGQGAAGANNGAAFNNNYNNWGGKSTSTIQEPDNFNSNQDAAAMALGNWPFGIAGEWNDIAETNSIYFVIEYNTIPTSIKQNSNKGISLEIYPNPSSDKIKIQSTTEIIEITITSIEGKILRTVFSSQKEQTIDISNLSNGIYFLNITSVNGDVIAKKIIKN